MSIIILFFVTYVIYYLISNTVRYCFGSPKPKEFTESFNHKTKMLEIECFGQEWWEAIGTKCDCKECTYVYSDGNVKPPVPFNHRIPGIAPKGAGGGSKGHSDAPKTIVTGSLTANNILTNKSRIEFLDGYQFTRPSDVPDNAHVEIYPQAQDNSDFSSVMFTWIDEKTGRHLALRAVATRDQFKAIHAPEFFTINERREIEKEKNAILHTANLKFGKPIRRANEEINKAMQLPPHAVKCKLCSEIRTTSSNGVCKGCTNYLDKSGFIDYDAALDRYSK